MNGWRRPAVPALLCLLLVLGCGCAEPSAERPGEVKPKGQQSLMRDARLRQVESGRVEVDFYAAEAWQDARGVIHARGVRVIYNPPEGARAILLTKGARYDMGSRKLEATGSVRLSSEGRLLETDRLSWDGEIGRVSTDGPVKVTQGENVLTGRGLDADPSLERIVVREDVKITAKDTEGFEPLVDALREK